MVLSVDECMQHQWTVPLKMAEKIKINIKYNMDKLCHNYFILLATFCG